MERTILPVSSIKLSSVQVRKGIDEETLKELAESIEESGLLHPVTVRPVDGHYELLAGGMRFRAIRDYIKDETIEVGIISVNDRQARRVSAIENWLRSGLSAVEQAKLVVALVNDVLEEDSLYVAYGDTPLERLTNLLSKLRSIKVSQDRGSELSDSSKQVLDRFEQQVFQTFKHLPKPMKWQSFFVHDLPLLELPESVREDSVKHGLNKEQTFAIAYVKDTAPGAYNHLVSAPLKALHETSDTSSKSGLSDCTAQIIRSYGDAHRTMTKKAKPEEESIPQHKREYLILKMHRLGIPQKRIAKQMGLARMTIVNIIKQEEALFNPIRKALRQRKAPEDVAEKFAAPLALVWSIHLEGLSDQERFQKLGWKLCTWDHLFWPHLDERFGDNWTGRIPARLVAHTLYFYTKPGDLVMDPMAGGGVVPDVCLLLGRRCWAFDGVTRQEHRPEIETHHWEAGQLKWPVRSSCKPALIFFDPPYFKKKEKEYGPESISALSRKEYLDFFKEFFKLAQSHVHPGGYITFLNGDWRDFQHTAAMEEDLSKSITVVDYGKQLQETGWQGPAIWDSPLPNSRFKPFMIAAMQKRHSIGVVRRSLLIARHPG